jgi:hypothetical protein
VGSEKPGETRSLGAMLRSLDFIPKEMGIDCRVKVVEEHRIYILKEVSAEYGKWIARAKEECVTPLSRLLQFIKELTVA